MCCGILFNSFSKGYRVVDEKIKIIKKNTVMRTETELRMGKRKRRVKERYAIVRLMNLDAN